MALVLPIIMMVLFGVIEFGATYNNFISLRDGTRNAARSASVGNFGTTTSCDLTGAGEASTNVQRLMCLTKEQIGLDTSKLRVKVVSRGYHEDWYCQFPRDLREEGARFVVDELREATQGGFYRVVGDIKRLLP